MNFTVGNFLRALFGPEPLHGSNDPIRIAEWDRGVVGMAVALRPQLASVRFHRVQGSRLRAEMTPAPGGVRSALRVHLAGPLAELIYCRGPVQVETWADALQAAADLAENIFCVPAETDRHRIVDAAISAGVTVADTRVEDVLSYHARKTELLLWEQRTGAKMPKIPQNNGTFVLGTTGGWV